MQMIKNAQSDNKSLYEPAIRYIVEKYTPLIGFYTKNMQNNDNLEDLKMAGYTGILEAIKSYEPNHKTSLKTWIYIHIRRRIGEERTKEFTVQLSRYHLKKGVKISHEQYKEEFDKSYENPPINTIIDEEEKEILLGKIALNNLKWKKKEVSIFTDFLVFNKSFKELDKTYKSNSRYILQKLVKRLKETKEMA